MAEFRQKGAYDWEWVAVLREGLCNSRPCLKALERLDL